MTAPIIDVLDTDLSPELREAICAPLREYNHSKNGDFFAKRELPENAPRPLNLIARDDAGQIIGGLIAETIFAWLKIDILSVAADSRHRGIGMRLMTAAESEARCRGCRYAFVETTSYQAPGFYEKLGYTVAGKLDDWDSHGNTKYLFVKQLS